MDSQRAVMNDLLPGLDAALLAEQRSVLEAPGGPGLELFKVAGGAGLLAPTESGGLGASAAEAVAVQMAVGSRSGSLAVATTMHHFSMASLLALARTSATGLEAILVEGIASQRHLLASGFAEGRPGAGILSPTMTAQPTAGGLLVSGVKKPCSLARSMTMLTASVSVVDPESGVEELAVVLVPAETPGITVEPFWRSPVLAGAESDAVRLDSVFVPDQLVVRTEMISAGPLDQTHRTGFLWFELLITASYLGVAAGLVEEAMSAPRAADFTVVGAWAQVHTAALALQRLAGHLDAGRCDDALLGEVLLCRYGLQAALPAVGASCTEALGGMSFIGSDELAHRTASLSCLAFHPPSLHRAAGPLRRLSEGHPLCFD